MDNNKSGFDEFTDSFTQDEIIQEYKKLLERYRQLKSLHEQDQQRIYDLKRSWETATAAESFLSHELEVISATQSAELEKAQEKWQIEIDVLKKKHLEAVQEVSNLEQKVAEFSEGNEMLLRRVEELESVPPKETAVVDTWSVEREMQLAKENLELLAKVDDCRDKMTSSLMTIAERERHIDILKEEVECLQENLHAKRDEVEEKNQLLESSQERVMELNAELAMLKSNPENANRKGNSLFAEVDDQRQQMKSMLAAQKKHYLHMKKCYTESEQEIRRLKRENAAMAKEMQVCASIFLSSDKRYKEKLNERIVQLLKRNEELEKKVTWTQEKLISLSLDKGINWLDSMLTFCRNETEDLKEQLRSCRLQKGILEEHLLKSQQDLAKWRFEALKSRCIIIDRETLLEENKIEFKPIVFKISEQQMDAAQPDIFTIYHTNKEVPIVPQQPTDVDNKSVYPLKKTNNSTHHESPPGSILKIDTARIHKSHEKYIETDSPNNIKFSTHIKQENQSSDDELKVRISTNTSKHQNLETTPTSSRISDKIAFVSNTNQSTCNSLRPQFIELNDENAYNSTEGSSKNYSAFINKKLSYTKTPFKKKCDVFSQEPEASKDSGMFEIYEDTVCKLPVIKCTDVSALLESTESECKDNSPKAQGISFNVYEDTIASGALIKSEVDDKPLQKPKNSENSDTKQSPLFFDIYEDTMCRLPVVKYKEFQDIPKENIPQFLDSPRLQPTNEKLSSIQSTDIPSSILTEHNTKVVSPPQSILVKGRNLLDDANDNKTVTFSPELTTEIKVDSNDYQPEEKPFRSKSQVSVKRIVIKSNFNNKK